MYVCKHGLQLDRFSVHIVTGDDNISTPELGGRLRLGGYGLSTSCRLFSIRNCVDYHSTC